MLVQTVVHEEGFLQDLHVELLFHGQSMHGSCTLVQGFARSENTLSALCLSGYLIV